MFLSQNPTIRKKTMERERKIAFEAQPSPIQALSFSFMEADSLLDAAMDRALPLFFQDGRATNLALLFSDQNPYLVEVGFFSGRDRSRIAGRQAIDGPLPLQLERALALLLEGSLPERPDYPPQALREALSNCLCHRDYAVRGTVQIAVFEDRIEMVNFGALEDGLTVDEIVRGVAHPRNSVLASFLYSANLADGFGAGIGKILAPYRQDRIKPSFESLGGVFRATIPNRNATDERKRERGYFVSEKDQILSYAREQGFATRRQVEELLACGPTKAYSILRELREEGFVRPRGKGPLSVYLPV